MQMLFFDEQQNAPWQGTEHNDANIKFRTSHPIGIHVSSFFVLRPFLVFYYDSQVLKCSVSFNFIRYVTDKNTAASLQSISSILNRDPTLGANDLIGTTADFAW